MIGTAFAAGDTAMRMAAMDAFISIFSRANIDNVDLEKSVGPIFNQQSLQLLHDAYNWASTAGPDEDDEKYSFAKKLAEVMGYQYLQCLTANFLGSGSSWGTRGTSSGFSRYHWKPPTILLVTSGNYQTSKSSCVATSS
jgi:hypothetical protein